MSQLSMFDIIEEEVKHDQVRYKFNYDQNSELNTIIDMIKQYDDSDLSKYLINATSIAIEYRTDESQYTIHYKRKNEKPHLWLHTGDKQIIYNAIKKYVNKHKHESYSQNKFLNNKYVRED